jgi:hypothetical protein
MAMNVDEGAVVRECEELLQDVLARIIAAIEELADEQTDEVARILADLEHDLAGAVSS